MPLPRLFVRFSFVAVIVAIGLMPTSSFAQSQQTAQLAVRIQQLEEQIRLLTGQVEGLQFQLTQMQALIERVTEDNEFRFQQLEGTADIGVQPNIDTGAVTPEQQQLPADPTTTAGLPELAPLDLGNGEPMHSDLGESSDPLVGTGSMGTGVLGSDEAALGGQPLDLSLDGGAQLSNGDADAQYEAGFDALQRGDYAFAEDQFQQFISLYPDNPNAPEATNWLGEALMQRGDFQGAALVLAEGYEKYQQSQRAPDLMLKLGVALIGTGEPDLACRTFFTLEKRYPEVAPAFRQRISDEKARAQCPV